MYKISKIKKSIIKSNNINEMLMFMETYYKGPSTSINDFVGDWEEVVLV
jgi:hypothetical protein